MGKGELVTAVQECAGILDAAGSEVGFYACDAKVHAALKVRTIEVLCEHLKGGGGTSFVPVFNQIEKVHPKPHILIFITDGGGDAPIDPPAGVHVIWLLVGAHRCRPHFGGWGAEQGEESGWGEFIEIDDELEEAA
jgi:predicted metal-dependent peptidase